MDSENESDVESMASFIVGVEEGEEEQADEGSVEDSEVVNMVAMAV